MTEKINNQRSEAIINSDTNDEGWYDLAQLVCDFAEACKWAGGKILSAPLNMGNWVVEKWNSCFQEDPGVATTIPANQFESTESYSHPSQASFDQDSLKKDLEDVEKVLLEVEHDLNAARNKRLMDEEYEIMPEVEDNAEESSYGAQNETQRVENSEKPINIPIKEPANPKLQKQAFNDRLQKFTMTYSDEGKQTIQRFAEVVENRSNDNITLIDKIWLREGQNDTETISHIKGNISYLVVPKLEEAIDEGKKYVFIPICDDSGVLTTVFELDLESHELTQCNLTEQHDLADKFRGKLQIYLMVERNKGRDNPSYIDLGTRIENSQQSSHPKEPSFMDRLRFLK